MKILINKTDKNGNELNIGDIVTLFDWGGDGKQLGIVELIWDDDEGRISSTPCIVEDAYDFWCKALPRCILVKRGA